MAIDLEGLVDDFVELAEGYSDLDFSAPYGRLNVTRQVPDVTCLRIELPWPNKTELQLASVLIDADGLDDPVAQTERRMSSAWSDEHAELLQRGDLFKPKRRQAAVRTKWEDRPWLEIEFKQPVDLRRLRLRNIGGNGPGGSSTRVRGIHVLVRTTDGWWTTIYDGWQREREFLQKVERKYSGAPLARSLETKVRRRLNRPATPQDHRVEGDLIKILASMQIGTYNTLKVFKDLNRVGLSLEEVAQLQRLVTDKILAKRQMEFNLHGLRRTFRFWSEAEKRRYLEFTVDVANCLRKLNDNVCLGFGSVLAVVRDHELLPHDDDLDVIIGFDPDQAATLAEGRELVKKCLTDNGFKVVGNFTSHTWVYPPWGGSKIDAFVSIFEGDSIAWYPSRRGTLTRDVMFPPSEQALMGIDCPVPRQPEAYLEGVYGPGWATPDPHYRHPWKRSEWSDLEK